MPDDRPGLPYVHIADAVIRNPAGELLLVHRSDDTWWLPGGRVEPGETFGDAVVREVAEETGLLVKPRGIVAMTEYPAEDCHEVFVTWAVDVVDGTPTVPEHDPKIQDVRWVSAEEAAALLPAYPSRTAILTAFPPTPPHFSAGAADG